LPGRWTLAVLSQSEMHGRHYRELRSALDGISHNVLTESLRRAERDGLLLRHVDPGRVESATFYELTDLARSLDGR
jgi:DNA-binding HxlR family transcriptional regulator